MIRCFALVCPIAIARVLLTGILLILISSLALLLYSYGSIHRAFLLEGNNLYSSNAMYVDSPPEVIFDSLGNLGPDARAFNQLEDGVRIVASNDYSQIPFPIHQGSRFSNTGRKEALVGSKVETIYEDGERYVTVSGQRYIVAGVLGMHPNSVLMHETLIKDDELFRTNESCALIIDGSRAGISGFP